MGAPVLGKRNLQAASDVVNAGLAARMSVVKTQPLLGALDFLDFCP